MREVTGPSFVACFSLLYHYIGAQSSRHPSDDQIVGWLTSTYEKGAYGDLVKKDDLYEQYYKQFSLEIGIDHHAAVTRIGELIRKTFPFSKRALLAIDKIPLKILYWEKCASRMSEEMKYELLLEKIIKQTVLDFLSGRLVDLDSTTSY